MTTGPMSIASLTLRTWLRYIVPFAILGVVALALVVWVGLGIKPPTDAPSARIQLRLGWELVAIAWIFQLWLVAGVAPAVRGIARGEPLSQASALGRGAVNLARAAVPCGVAVLAIVLGCVALVVPGLVLLALLAMTGASDDLGQPLPAALVDSIAAARSNLRAIGIVVAIVVGVDLAIVVVAQLAILPALPKKPPLALLLPARAYVRAIAAGLVAISPVAATAIAAVYARRR